MQRQVDWHEFNTLASAWKSRKKTQSFTGAMVADPNYLRIIGMGEVAVPFILRQLEIELNSGEPDHWFAALWAITGENPIPAESQGNVHDMARAWLEWGERRGLLH